MRHYKNQLISLAKKGLVIAAFASVATLSQAAIYTIDPGHANARFYIDHFGTSTNAGMFTQLTGMIEYDPAKKTGFVGVTIPTGSLNTGFKPFETHLKSADFFNVKEYPTAYFKSTNWQFDGDRVDTVTGNLTLLGQTHPVTLKATKFNCYDSPIINKHVCGGDFETVFDRTDWGMDTYAVPGGPNDVRLVVQVEAILED